MTHKQWHNKLWQTVEANCHPSNEQETTQIDCDFNMPDIEWQTKSINSHNYKSEINQHFLDIALACGME